VFDDAYTGYSIAGKVSLFLIWDTTLGTGTGMMGIVGQGAASTKQQLLGYYAVIGFEAFIHSITMGICLVYKHNLITHAEVHLLYLVGTGTSYMSFLWVAWVTLYEKSTF
jgi:hypothetical protein